MRKVPTRILPPITTDPVFPPGLSQPLYVFLNQVTHLRIFPPRPGPSLHFSNLVVVRPTKHKLLRDGLVDFNEEVAILVQYILQILDILCRESVVMFILNRIDEVDANPFGAMDNFEVVQSDLVELRSLPNGQVVAWRFDM